MTPHGPDAKILPVGLPAADELLPVLWQVIEIWHEREHLVQSWDDAVRAMPPAHEGWAGLAELLQLINTFQWHEEDRSRVHDADSETLAAVKQSIDASNARRVKTIELFDGHVMKVLATAGLPVLSAPLHSESPGSIVDRITVLALKLYHIREELSTAGGTGDEAKLHARLESLKVQMDDLAGCLDGLFLDIAAGLRRIKLYRQVKVYKDPATGRYRSGLED
jgi:hypothetical protein